MATRGRLYLDSRINLSRVRVLVIDDNSHSRKIMSAVLAGFGIREQYSCESAQAAQVLIAKHSFDLIISDCNMPDVDGFDFVHWLRRSGHEPNAFATVVMVTSHTQTSKVKKARDCGANYTVAKPITPNVLLDRLIWVARDRRPFVEAGSYLGPDRRYKPKAPPQGIGERRGCSTSSALSSGNGGTPAPPSGSDGAAC